MGNDAGSGWLHLAAQFIEHFLASLWALLQALPEAPAAHARALTALLGTGGRPLALTLLLTALSLAALFAPGATVRARPFTFEALRGSQWQGLAARMANDAIAIGGAILAATLVVAVVLTQDTALDKFCIALVMATLRWRVAFFGVTAFLRRAQEAQPPVIEDFRALRIGKFCLGAAFALTFAFVSIIPVMLSNGGPPAAQLALDPSRGTAIIYSILVAALAAFGVINLSRAAPRWRLAVLAAGLALTLALWAVWVYSVVELDFGFYDAFTGLITLIWVLALVDALVRPPPRPSSRQKARPPPC